MAGRPIKASACHATWAEPPLFSRSQNSRGGSWRGPGLRVAGTRIGRERNVSDAPEEMSREEMLAVRLSVLRQEHRDLDESIAALEAEGRADMLTIRRLKRRKLALRDAIARIEDELTPDIIA